MDKLSGNFSDKLISNITNALDCDMVCFMNPDTYEVEDVPHGVLSGMYTDEVSQKALERVDRWGKYITIDRPNLSDTIKTMRSFVNEHIPSGELKEQLHGALAMRRPDKYFHEIVECSDYRDKWATYNRRQMMRHVQRKLKDSLNKEASLPGVAIL